MSRYKNVYVNGKLRQEHRLVWEKAHGPIPDGYEIHHIDGNGHNNDLSNLRLMTRSEHATLHAKLREEGNDVVDSTDPEIIRHRNVTKRYCEINRERRREKNAEYRASHVEQERSRKRKYYAEHRDERLDYSRRYREEHNEEILAYGREYGKRYYAENKDKIRKKRADYNKKHKDEIASKNAAYYDKHKEEIAAYQARYREIHRPIMRAQDKLRIAKKRNAPIDIIEKLEAEVSAARVQVDQIKRQMM